MRVLRAYSNFDREIGYTQGMNFVTAAILIILHPETYKDQQSSSYLLLGVRLIAKFQGYFEDYAETYEEKAFWILVHLMYEKNWRSVFRDGTPKLMEMTKYFEKALRTEAPEIYQKIINTNVC